MARRQMGGRVQVKEQGQDQDLLFWVSQVLPPSITCCRGIGNSLGVKAIMASHFALFFSRRRFRMQTSLASGWAQRCGYMCRLPALN